MSLAALLVFKFLMSISAGTTVRINWNCTLTESPDDAVVPPFSFLNEPESSWVFSTTRGCPVAWTRSIVLRIRLPADSLVSRTSS
jgi:hypothetical protein